MPGQSTGRSGQQSTSMKELKEGISLEPALDLLRKKTKHDWTGKPRNVARKIFFGRRTGA